jgi:hypothetical protein
MVILDRREDNALHHLLRLMDEAAVQPRVVPIVSRLSRGKDGPIVVPVELDAAEPSIPLALLLAHKAEQVYRQTGCRFLVAQRPSQDPTHGTYLWGNDRWDRLS